MTAPLLSVEGLKVWYPGQARPAVDGVSFSICAGECLAVVGESGSGKSTVAAAIGRLTDLVGARCEGRVLARSFADGPARERDVMTFGPRELREFRRDFAAYVFQEPASSLNPVMRVEEQFFEIAGFGRGRERVEGFLRDVRIGDTGRAARAYPHELSGGMQQRVMIAMALAKDARLLIADEPTTALDATVQKEVLALISELKRTKGLAVLLVTHDLWAARATADRILVMRGGRAIEMLDQGQFERPVDPYTRALMAAALLDGTPKTPISCGERSGR